MPEGNHTIHNWHDLRDYGIEPLTGEADRYGMRILCDLSQKGVDLLSRFLGHVEFKAERWNSKVGDDDSVASVMLVHELFPALCRFVMFHVHGHRWVIDNQRGAVIGTDEERHVTCYRQLSDTDDSIRIYTNMGWSPTQPVAGDRNVHAFTGRAE